MPTAWQDLWSMTFHASLLSVHTKSYDLPCTFLSSVPKLEAKAVPKFLYKPYLDHAARVRETYGDSVQFVRIERRKTTRIYFLQCLKCSCVFTIFESNIIRTRKGSKLKRECPECTHRARLAQLKDAEPEYHFTDVYRWDVFAICPSGHRFTTKWDKVMNPNRRYKELCEYCR